MEQSSVLVIGAGPAGVFAALRAADLGAATTLITSGAFGGMAANDGPVPVRTLAHAARLMREARQMPGYGIAVGAPRLDYRALLERVAANVEDVRSHSALRREIDAAGVIVHEQVGKAHFVDDHMVETASGQRFQADRLILCTGGESRRLPIPGFDLVATHSDAWSLEGVPESMIVIGAGATGLQLASIFAAFGTRVDLFEAGRRILPTEEEEVAREVATAFRARGIAVHEGFGSIDRFELTEAGIRMVHANGGETRAKEAALAVSAVGWCADAGALDLAAAGVATDPRGYIRTDAQGRTSAPHIFAAGDVTGGAMLAPQAMLDAFVAASAALDAPAETTAPQLVPVGSFTDPEYARVGLTEDQARAKADVVATQVRFEEATRPIIDGRTIGFCKLVVDRAERRILGCSIVGERAVDVVQVASVAMAAGMTVDALARFPLSFPIYAGVLWQAAARAAHALGRAG